MSDKIQLIKNYRAQTGCSLIEAKKAVENFIRLAAQDSTPKLTAEEFVELQAENIERIMSKFSPYIEGTDEGKAEKDSEDKLRDYFAGQALNGIFATNPDTPQGNDAEEGVFVMAKLSYIIADAMLRARKQV